MTATPVLAHAGRRNEPIGLELRNQQESSVSRFGTKSGQSITAGGRIAGTLFFFVFFAMGLAFCGFIGREFWLSLQTHQWTSVPCQIVESRVERSGDGEHPYRLIVRFSYQWERSEHTGTRHRRKHGSYSSHEEARDVAERFPASAAAACFVNPSDPTEAVLEKSTLWIGLVILFPLIFVAVGAGGIWAMWTSKSKPDNPSEIALSNRAQIKARAAKTGWAVTYFIAGVFALAGAIASFFMLVRPLAGILAARSWQPVTCTILSSDVQRHRSSKSTTYRVDIFYEYEFNGRTYQSSRYKFAPGSTSGYSAKAEVVRRYQKGSRATCFVDPQRPSQAVLERGATPDLWIGLIPLMFTVGGVTGFIVMRRRRTRSPVNETVRSASTIPSVPNSSHASFAFAPLATDASEPRVLKSSSSRIGTAVAIGIFAAIWNGVIFFGFLRSMKFFTRGPGDLFDWFQFLFMLPFVAVGLLLVGLVVHSVLGLFNPKVTLRLAPGTPALGGRIALEWELDGRFDRLRGLEIFLEGREEAKYRRGTSTYTDRKTFLKLPVHSTTGGVLATGQGSATLPLRSMPTFDSGNNKIIWAVHVKGEIPRWPDLKEEFVIQVQPPATNIRHERPEDSAT